MEKVVKSDPINNNDNSSSLFQFQMKPLKVTFVRHPSRERMRWEGIRERGRKESEKRRREGEERKRQNQRLVKKEKKVRGKRKIKQR